MFNTSTWRPILLLFLLFLVGLNSIQAQKFKQLDIEDGLPSNNVYSIYEDSLGFIWFATDNGVVKYDGYEFISIDFNSIGASNDVWEIYDDADGRIWFSSERNLVYLEQDSLYAIPFPDSLAYALIRYHLIDERGNHIIYLDSHPIKVVKPKGQKPRFEELHIKNSTSSGLLYLKGDAEGNEWYLCRYHGVIKLLKCENHILKVVDSIAFKESGNHSHQTYSYSYPKYLKDGRSILFTEIGTYNINFEDNLFEKIYLLPKNVKVTYAGIHAENMSWMQTNKGVFYIDKNLSLISDLQPIENVKTNITFEDSKGNIWVCTYGSGVYFLKKSYRRTKNISKDINGEQISNIFDMAKDKAGNIWFTNDSKKIYKINEKNQVIPFDFNHLVAKEGDVLRYLEFDRYGNLYLSSSQFNCLVIPSQVIEGPNLNVKLIPKGIDDVPLSEYAITFQPNEIYTIYNRYTKHISKTKNGDIVIGNSSMSTIIKPQEHAVKIKLFYKTERTYAGTIWKDHLVAGKTNNLLFVPLSEKSPEIKLNLQQPIEALLTDKNNYLWISTKNDRVYRYNGSQLDSIPEINQFKLRVFNMLETDQGFLLSTNKGLARVTVQQQSPFQYTFNLFSEEHGLITTRIYETAIKDNHLYLSTQKGINILPLDQLENAKVKRPLFFTRLLLNSKNTRINFKDYATNYFPLKHDINHIRINFSCLPYVNEKNIYYEYRTLGINDEWQPLQTNVKEFDINTLRFGKYTFEVRARNVNGILSDVNRFNFQTLPPWWNTWWAYCFYLTVFLGTFYYVYKQSVRREKIEVKHEALAQLDKAKTNFFTNITHELRTPLTIISSLVQLEENNKQHFDHASFFVDMKTHTHTMLYLINQLLDISKLEAGAMAIYYDSSDIVQFCKKITTLFAKTSGIKQQKLHFYSNISTLITSFDHDKIERILYNLISNAIKYTQQRGTIAVTFKVIPERSNFQIEIKDNGPGIEPESIPTIFNKFTNTATKQINSTGIGLYLTKELTRLLGGDIQLQSSKKGSTFTVDLPFATQHQNVKISRELYEMPIHSKYEEDVNHSHFQLQQHSYTPQLLLIDDNPNLLNVLQKLLAGKYDVLLAKNAEAGLNLALENVPELIISDIMMPEMDGFELCRRLKANVKTSHIPIVLLSAKSEQHSKIKGQSLGINAYITKPFNHIELLNTIENLITQRSKIRDKYANLDLLINTQEKSKEDQFVLQIKNLIENNINDINLDVNFLCSSMYMSRTQLHNKLKYTTGLSTRKFIRKIRLEHGKKLIQDFNLKITNIAYEVGMQPKYFSKMFHETYGETPSQYRKRIISEKKEV